MSPTFSSIEYSEILETVYACHKNALNASRMYLAKYPNRRQPSKNTFINVEKTLKQTGISK